MTDSEKKDTTNTQQQNTASNKLYYKAQKDMSGKQNLLMIPLLKFFYIKDNMDKLLDVVNGKSRISLRLIDWFVTNYAKKNNIMYLPGEYNNKSNKKKKKTKKKEIKEAFSNYFVVFHSYKLQLKEVSKKHFDPFCRRSRIQFYYDINDKNKYILTTVGQLNFFKWAIENNILNYIDENFKHIENDMNENSKQSNTKKTDKGCGGVKKNKLKKQSGKTKKKSDSGKQQRKKRKELSPAVNKSIMKYNYPTTIKFD